MRSDKEREVQEQHSVLETICEEAKAIEITSANKEIFNYQLVSALYGKDLIKFSIQWFENLLSRMRKDEI